MTRASAALALGLLGSTQGCMVTYLTGEAAPRLYPERLLGADLDEEGHLALGIERADGEAHLYTGRIGGGTGGEVTLADEGPIAATDPPRAWTLRGIRSGTVIELPAMPGDPDRSPVVIHLQEAWPRLTIVDASGVPVKAFLHLEGETDWNWRHPGTWLVGAAMPVTFALDVVLFPVEALLFVALAPDC